MNCKEFVNADNIAAGLSPFQPEKVAFEAGRIMLERIEYLLEANEIFAIETTLATKIYKSKLLNAIENGYNVKLLFFWLPNVEMAINRVAIRVSEGGHNIPIDVISRRYSRGIENLFKIYLHLCKKWAVFDNSDGQPQMIAQGIKSEIDVVDSKNWNLFKVNIR